MRLEELWLCTEALRCSEENAARMREENTEKDEKRRLQKRAKRFQSTRGIHQQILEGNVGGRNPAEGVAQPTSIFAYRKGVNSFP